MYQIKHPEHSKTSCSDKDLYNVSPSMGWCFRCNAILMDRGQSIDWDALNELLDLDLELNPESTEFFHNFQRYLELRQKIIDKKTQYFTVPDEEEWD